MPNDDVPILILHAPPWFDVVSYLLGVSANNLDQIVPATSVRYTFIPNAVRPTNVRLVAGDSLSRLGFAAQMVGGLINDMSYFTKVAYNVATSALACHTHQQQG